MTSKRELSDEQLVELVKAGDSSAVDELFDRYKYIVSAVTHSYFLTGGDSEDLLQEGMFAVFKAITTFNGKASFKSYVYTCVKNRIFSVIKKFNRLKNQPLNNYISLSGFIEGDNDKTEIVIDSGFGPEDVYINTETANELKTLIKDTLSDYEFTILKLYLKGYSHKEISLDLQKKEKSIDNALQRIRKKLLKVLNEKKGIVK